MKLKEVFRVVQPAATRRHIATLRAAIGPLPDSYTEFLLESNGAEWCIHDQGGDCLALWTTKEIPQLNEDYEIARWLPDLLVIGSNGGGDGIGFDRAASQDPELWSIVRIGFGNLDRADFVRLANGFADWRAREFRLAPQAVPGTSKRTKRKK
jgi:hypothetical protein